jgi:hypothetical protein
MDILHLVVDCRTSSCVWCTLEKALASPSNSRIMQLHGSFQDDGNTEPEILFIHANDHRRWRIAQTIERLRFNLCFGFNLYELLVDVY